MQDDRSFVTQSPKSCPTLGNPMDCSMPGLPVPHHLPKFAQVHVQESVMSPNHLILLCLTLLLPSIFARIPMSQLFTSGKILEFQLQHQSFQWVFKVDFHLDWLVWSPCFSRDSQKSKWLSKVFSSTTVPRHQFFGALLFLQFSSHNHTWPPERK